MKQRALGVVMGAAVGDALGYPVEFIDSIEGIRARHGVAGVTGFVEYRVEGGKRFAPYSDDTQMAEICLRTLLWSRASKADLDATMRKLAAGFAHWWRHPLGGHRAPGRACMNGSRALEQGVPWGEAGDLDAGGCGSVMRVYPFALAFAREPDRAEAWGVAQSLLTHGAPIALAACAAMVRGVLAAGAGLDVRATVRAMHAAAARYDAGTAEMIAEAERLATSGAAPETVLGRFLGWAAHDAIAAATYVYARHAEAPATALLEAVNSPGDSDSLGTLVGALVGARWGAEALPPAWRAEVERSEELEALGHEAAAAFEDLATA